MVLSLTASAFAISGIVNPCFLSCPARVGFDLVVPFLPAAINPSIFGRSDSCLLALSAILKFDFCQPEHDAGCHPSNGTA